MKSSNRGQINQSIHPSMLFLIGPLGNPNVRDTTEVHVAEMTSE